jgi:glycerol-3-phosphate acyltransferase PlsX
MHHFVIDAMGGDNAPGCNVLGAHLALQKFPDVELTLTGHEQTLRAEYTKIAPIPTERLYFLNTTQLVTMDDKGTEAVRRKKDSSLTRAFDLVAEKKAHAVISAGNTSAAVFAATLKLRLLPKVERVGIAVILPGSQRPFVLIDAGANTDPRPSHLAQYAIMGTLFSKLIHAIPDPEVGLMNVGTEEGKGTDLTREAYDRIKKLPLRFRGNIEGRDLYENSVDVVVTDGFTGNVILKTSESIAGAMMRWIKKEITASPIATLGALLAKPAFQKIKQKTDYEEYGGMPLLGVDGLCIIAHGSSSHRSILNSVRVARLAAQAGLNKYIAENIAKI